MNLAGFMDVFSAPSIERPFEQEAPIPRQEDGLDRMVAAMKYAYEVEGLDERGAALKGLEIVREEMIPQMHVPRRSSARVSQKVRRRTLAALDQRLNEWRAR